MSNGNYQITNGNFVQGSSPVSDPEPNPQPLVTDTNPGLDPANKFRILADPDSQHCRKTMA
jgi:hypothetical protein